jgi:hypothetical protein
MSNLENIDKLTLYNSSSVTVIIKRIPKPNKIMDRVGLNNIFSFDGPPV